MTFARIPRPARFNRRSHHDSVQRNLAGPQGSGTPAACDHADFLAANWEMAANSMAVHQPSVPGRLSSSR